MFCGKCGNTLREGAHFCPKCGAQTVSVSAPSASASSGPVKPKKKGLKIFVLAAATLVLVGAIIGSSILFAPPEDVETVATKFVDTMMNADYYGMNRYLAMPYDKVFPDVLETYEQRVKKNGDGDDSYYADSLKLYQQLADKDIMNKSFKKLSSALDACRKKAYGSDYKRSIEVTYVDTLSGSEKSEALQQLKSMQSNSINSLMHMLRFSNYFAMNKVDEICKVTCEVYEEGSENFASFEISVTFICVDGKYKALESEIYPLSGLISYFRSIDSSVRDFYDWAELDQPLKNMLGFG